MKLPVMLCTLHAHVFCFCTVVKVSDQKPIPSVTYNYPQCLALSTTDFS